MAKQLFRSAKGTAERLVKEHSEHVNRLHKKRKGEGEGDAAHATAAPPPGGVPPGPAAAAGCPDVRPSAANATSGGGGATADSPKVDVRTKAAEALGSKGGGRGAGGGAGGTPGAAGEAGRGQDKKSGGYQPALPHQLVG
eukprot:2954986-Pyramimonas_sp.AAC.1